MRGIDNFSRCVTVLEGFPHLTCLTLRNEFRWTEATDKLSRRVALVHLKYLNASPTILRICKAPELRDLTLSFLGANADVSALLSFLAYSPHLCNLKFGFENTLNPQGRFTAIFERIPALICLQISYPSGLANYVCAINNLIEILNRGVQGPEGQPLLPHLRRLIILGGNTWSYIHDEIDGGALVDMLENRSRRFCKKDNSCSPHICAIRPDRCLDFIMLQGCKQIESEAFLRRLQRLQQHGLILGGSFLPRGHY
ncbi:hypothetical protein BJ138DRAFT_1166878 [Hygrophoropsis aurantiaca]|uniref:Uncharacterized protein n=1 Tax=Hygrophoropsis aurantiaca TaxID=72124 RepID=A0ACB7ZUA0_9AGAM|nr:hypothetical protein BJ138DRAFT_1166878 [Hygrophoropsis aurantiaca]